MHSIKSGGSSQVSEKNDTERIQSELSFWFDKTTPSNLKDSRSPNNIHVNHNYQYLANF